MTTANASIQTSPIAFPSGSAQRRPVVAGGRPKRLLFAGCGVCCVGLGGVGVVVPGLPTTVFLIVASWCFARSCPWLTEKLIHNRFFGPFVKYLEPGAVMPLRAKVISMAMMWAAIVGSCGWVVYRGAPWFVPVSIAVSGLVGTWFIARQGRKAKLAASEAFDESGARSTRHGVGRRSRAHNGACIKPTAPHSTKH